MMKKAYTFIEVMAVMIVIGFLFVITALSASRFMTDNKMARFKKGYASIESAVSFLISNKSIYGTRKGFKDTSRANLVMSKETNDTVTTVNTGEVIGRVDTRKFRDGFKYYLDVVKDDLVCKMYPNTASHKCFMTDSGVVFGIPETDFVDMNMVTIRDSDGDKIKVLPITMYVDYDENTNKDPSRDAFVIGVQYDGNLHFMRTYENCAQDKDALQCKLDYYIKSNSVSKAGEDSDE